MACDRRACRFGGLCTAGRPARDPPGAIHSASGDNDAGGARAADGDAGERRDFVGAAGAPAQGHAGLRRPQGGRRHRHPDRTRRQGRGRARFRLPGCRGAEGHASRHDLPHRVDDQAHHQRGRDDAAGRGQASPHRSRVEVHPGFQGPARDRRRWRDSACAARDDGPRPALPSLRALVWIPEWQARSATPTARRACPTA